VSGTLSLENSPSSRLSPFLYLTADGSLVVRRLELVSLIGLTVLFGLAAIPIAVIKPLTNDEIYSFAVARLPHYGSIWHALASGADNHPPLDYWLRHFSMSIFGPTRIGLRFPSLLAVWAGILLLAQFLTRRLGHPTFGWAAGLLTLIVGGYQASLVTRGYALLVLFFALTLVGAWGIETGRRDGRYLIFLLLGLVGAVYSHYYGILYLLALIASSLTLRLTTGRPQKELVVLIATAVALSIPLFSLLPAASQFRTNFWTPVTVTSALALYPNLLSGAIPCLLTMAALAAISSVDSRPQERTLSVELIVLILSFAITPLFMLVLAKLAVGAFLPRYVLGAGVAICCMSVALLGLVPMEKRRRSQILVFVPVVFMAVPPFQQLTGLLTHRHRATFVERLDHLQRGIGMPVVIGDDGLFVEISHSEPADSLSNCFFVYDVFPTSRTNVDKAITGLMQVMPLRAVSYATVRETHAQFAFIGGSGDRVITRSMQDGAKLTLTRDGADGLEYWIVSFTSEEERLA
jgi:hypothetical protein